MGKVVVSHIAVARPERATPEELCEILESIVKEGLVAMPATLLIGNVAAQSPGYLDPDAPPSGTTVAWRGDDLADLLDALSEAWRTHDLLVLFRTWSPTTLAEVGFALVSLRQAREITLFTASDPLPSDSPTWDDAALEEDSFSDDDAPDDDADPDAAAGTDEDRVEPVTVLPTAPHEVPQQTVHMGMDGNELVYGEGSVGPFFDYVVIEGRDAPQISELDCTDITDILSMTCHARLTLCQSAW